ncbi:hypothetical protein P22_2442 [Propionispora sp. 2/2-37]|uniref:guanylate kinase n=1 Tax=Propionispora sp. 2/2-37 TaxID=1677858 RepID=UPI0006BB6C6A|nr:hypothetical protein [Propionispora sp. 2/2-37]CUH96352.1 hypothetical protein P22_2442 [Propionispora sp. 2/2-37]
MHKVYAIIGPPASGKTSIVKGLFAGYRVPALVSHTTRQPRTGEEQGKDYYFVGEEEFSRTVFLEKANYSGYFYGLSKEEVVNKVGVHPVSVVDITLAGFEQLKKVLGERVAAIYLLVDKDTVINRYILRGDDAAVINKTIEYAQQRGEFNNWEIADHVVKNTGELDIALRQVAAIMNLT